MKLEEKIEHYEQVLGAKHFTCLECGSEYIGQYSEQNPICVNCRDTRMVNSRYITQSLTNFLKHA